MFEDSGLRVLGNLDPMPVFDFPLHTVATDYQEFATIGAAGDSYEFAGVVTAPSLRIHTLSFELFKYFKLPDDAIDYDSEPTYNAALLDRLYNSCHLDKEMLYNHPVLGWIKVRFYEPITIPQGLNNGLGSTASTTVKLVEVPTQTSDITFKSNSLPTFLSINGLKVFPCVFHKVSTTYLKQSTVVPLGGNYSFRVGPNKPEQRIFKLNFDAMVRYLAQDGKLDLTTNTEFNLNTLEYFYFLHRTSVSFYYEHPVYGLVSVRFKSPLSIPAGEKSGQGSVKNIGLELIEVFI